MNTDFSFILQGGEEKSEFFHGHNLTSLIAVQHPEWSFDHAVVLVCMLLIPDVFIQKDCRAIQSKQESISSPQMFDCAVSLQGRPFKKGVFTDLHHQQLGRSKRARNFSWYKRE